MLYAGSAVLLVGCAAAVPYHAALAPVHVRSVAVALQWLAALQHHIPCLLAWVHNTDKIPCNLAGAERAPLRDIQRAPAGAAPAPSGVPAAGAAPTPRSTLTGEQATLLQLLQQATPLALQQCRSTTC